MRNIKFIPIAMAFTFSVLSCYNPALPVDPFLCGAGGSCPEGYTCYGGTCMNEEPACMAGDSLEFAGWPDDSDLEPNDHPDLAVTLPCGDDGVHTDPVSYVARCPSRQGYTNGFMNLLTCPNGDRDFYKIYLLPDEVVAFRVMFQHDMERDIDARIWREDPFFSDPECPSGWNCRVSVGLSTNDNEGDADTGSLIVNTTTGTNPPGWYYLEVFGKSYQDLNFYTVSFTLNASEITP